jgi:hypothetical protein
VEDCREHGNEPSSSIKRWEILEMQHSWWLVKKGSAPSIKLVNSSIVYSKYGKLTESYLHKPVK